MLQVIYRVIASFLIKQAGLKRSAADTGVVTLIQRFGSTSIFRTWVLLRVDMVIGQ